MSDENTVNLGDGQFAPALTPSRDDPAPVEMADVFATEEPKKREYDGDEGGLRKAAAEVAEKRQQDPDIVERTYIQYSGKHAGQPVPMNQTVSAERAADDLTRQRGFEAAELEQADNMVTAIKADSLRTGISPEQIVDTLVQQQQQQQQPEQIQPQPETETPGVDPEIVHAVQSSPKLRAALEQTAAQVQQFQRGAENARQQYAQATQQLAQAAIDATVASFPEIAGLTMEQLPAALKVLEANNPQRYNAVVSHLARAQQAGQVAQQARQQQQAIQQQQLQQWALQQDQAFEQSIKNESPETVKAVKENVVRVAKEVYGVSAQELRAAYDSNPIVRSAAFGRMMFDATRWHLAQQAIKEHRSNPVPPVQRPGVSQPRTSADDAAVESLRASFLKNPDPKTAAKYLTAKRAARG